MAQISLSESIKQITLPDPLLSFENSGEEKKEEQSRRVIATGRLLRFFFYKSYLVDPASSHMLVSKIKPCMSKYKQLCTVKLRMAH
jgi:hypothetical protein